MRNVAGHLRKNPYILYLIWKNIFSVKKKENKRNYFFSFFSLTRQLPSRCIAWSRSLLDGASARCYIRIYTLLGNCVSAKREYKESECRKNKRRESVSFVLRESEEKIPEPLSRRTLRGVKIHTHIRERARRIFSTTRGEKKHEGLVKNKKIKKIM